MFTARLTLILSLAVVTLWQTVVPCCAGSVSGRHSPHAGECACPCDDTTAVRSGCGCRTNPIEQPPFDEPDDRTCPFCKGEVSPSRVESAITELHDDGGPFPADACVNCGPRAADRDGVPSMDRCDGLPATRGTRSVPLRI